MANNRIQVKRTSVSGRLPNTTSSGNSTYIAAGELALNLADGILYSSNGSSIIPIGANNVNINVTGNLTANSIVANGSVGSLGNYLTSDGSRVYWSAPLAAGVNQVNTGVGLTGGPITNTGTISVNPNTGIVANATGLFVNATYIGTLSANNATYLNGQLASYYTNATNITTGTLPYAQIPANVVNTTNQFTFTAGQIIDVNNSQLFLHFGSGTSHPTVIHRNDGSNYYILLSNANTAASGSWNSLRPLMIGLSDGRLVSNNGQTFSGGTTFNSNVTINGALNANDVVVAGNLTVSGTTVTVNTATLDVKDLNITVAKGAGSSALSNGAGLTVDFPNAQIFYTSSDDSWNSNKPFDVVVNTTTDAVRITQTGTGNALVVEDESNPDSTPFVINQNGDVIQGHTSTVTSPTSYSSVFQIHRGGNAATGLGAYNWNANAGARGDISFYKSVSGSFGTLSAVASGQDIGGITFWGAANTSAWLRTSLILGEVDTGTVSDTSMPGRLTFFTTADGDNTSTERMRIDNAGRVGIGAVPVAGRALTISTPITGNITSQAVRAESTIQSDVTNEARGFASVLSTQATSFTLTGLSYFTALQGSFGVGSSVTSQYGFIVNANLIGATNNYGFFGAIPDGSGRWNFYAAGTAPNFFNGNVGIGTTSVSGYTLRASKSSDTASYVGIGSTGSDTAVSSTASFRFYSVASTSANAGVPYTLARIDHYNATQGTFNADSTVTNQYGFHASSTLVGATNNYGFYSNIPDAANRWNFYANGTAPNFFGGATTISVNSTTNALSITQVGSGNALVVEDEANPDATPFVITADGNVGIGTTTPSVGLQISGKGNPSVIVDFYSDDPGGAGYLGRKARGTASAPTAVQTGDFISVLLARGYGNTAFGSSNVGLLAFQAAENFTDSAQGTYFTIGTTPTGSTTRVERVRIDSAGQVGIGATPAAGRSFTVNKSLTGSTFSYQITASYTIASDVTSEASSFISNAGTQAASFTLTNLRLFKAQQSTFGAGSTVTNQTGFWADSTLIGATNNYGFYSNIPNGTGRWNFYAGGTAPNYFVTGIFDSPNFLTSLGGRVSRLQTHTSSNTPNALILGNWYGAGTNFGTEIQFIASKSGTVGTYGSSLSADQVLGVINFYGDDSTKGIAAAQIVANVDGTPGVNDMPGRLVFSTTLDGQNTLTERMRIDNAGLVGIGGAAPAGVNLAIGRALTGATTSFGVRVSGSVASDVTANARYFQSLASTFVGSFTLTNLEHFRTVQGAFGAGSAVTNQFGFLVDSTLIGATNNYGFYGNIPDGTGRWNFYADGTAPNYFAGRVGVGVTSPQAILDVTGSSTSSYSLQLRSGDIAAGTDSAQIIFSFNGAPYNSSGYAHSIRTRHNSGTEFNNAIDFWLWHAGVDTASTLGSRRVMTIEGTGRVGIGTATPGYNLEVNGSFAATTKSFVIDHPTKPGKKLRYGSLEGPENGVYVRGKVEGNIIELPEYWTKLVDPDSITVQLTPIGKHQKLFVEDIKDNKIFIGNDNIINKQIKCFYTVYVERIDVDKLEIEID